MIKQYPSKEELDSFKTELIPGKKAIINSYLNV